MKIVFFTFYYPPDLGAGSFRSVSLARALSQKMDNDDELHIITTHPHRYAAYKATANDVESDERFVVHRINIPRHKNTILSQIQTFGIYAVSAYRLSRKLNPDFLIGTTSRLMTGLLTGYSARSINCKYFIDVRDIFSETISDLFTRKNKILGAVFKSLFSFIEKGLFHGAAGVNVVSEGFFEYFDKQGVNTSRWTFFPNGVDREFQDLQLKKDHKIKKHKTILYAGNIGDGQALDSILPNVAQKLGDSYRFLVIGCGGMKRALDREIKNKQVRNITVLPPVDRSELIEYYQRSDILFLHLNNISAFYRVLPSKIFEYAALKRPIVAGLEGYSAEFLQNNISHVALFSPKNVDQCIASIKGVEFSRVDDNQVDVFIKKYAREKIMKEMADHIFTIL